MSAHVFILLYTEAMKKSTLVLVITWLLILLFTYAALSKLFDYSKFRVQLGQSPLLTTLAGSVAWAVPMIELGIALLLYKQKTRMAALYGSFSLMVMFTAYIVVITKFSDYVPCSCGGILQNLSWGQHLVFNVVFTLLAAIAVLMNEGAPEGPARLSEIKPAI